MKHKTTFQEFEDFLATHRLRINETNLIANEIYSPKKSTLVGDLLAAIFILALICLSIAGIIAIFGPNLT